VGLYSLTTNIAIPEYASIDIDYVAISKRNITELRERGAEVILAVTHLKMSEDVALLEQLGEQGPDLILGGHEHNRQYKCVGKRCVVKADADIRSATVVKITVNADKEVIVEHHFSILDQSTITSDPEVEKKTDAWLARYQQEYCDKNQLPSGCLTEVFGKTAVNLIAEELEIRRYETNLGAYIADLMISAFDQIDLPDGRKVQASLINSGSLRLNQNIPAGSDLNQWNINGIFQYPVGLRLLEVSGKTLKQMIDHTIEDWTGNGWWLQVSGLAFRHDPVNQRATQVSLIDENGKPTLVADDDKIVVVVNNYMADASISNQDGYTMLTLDDEVPYADKLIELKTVVIDAIKSSWAKGEAITPKLPGRVCLTTRPESFCVLD
jgi:2',3'-cyclic-nucleotide 2'-phosphodiesterase (5'-nucleotidase family)